MYLNEEHIHNRLLHMYLSLEDEGMANVALTELKTRYPFYRNTVVRRP